MFVIIPTYNEAQAIGRVLADLPSDLVTKVIVVDSDSNDGTPEIAARMGACVIQESRRGYGRACLTGLAAADSADVVVFLDGDYSDRPSELPILLSANHRGPTRTSHSVPSLAATSDPAHCLGTSHLAIAG